MKRALVKNAVRALAAAAVVLAVQGSAFAQTTALWWKAPATPEVAWRGMLPTEGSGVGMGVQIGPYPAFGAAGLLVAIFTHAAIQKGVQDSARKKEQEEADRVLQPYSEALAAWPARALWEATIAASSPPALQLWEGTGTPPEGVWLEAAPVFTLAQDEGVLVLDVAVKHVATQGAKPAESVVRVVSSPHQAADARAHWSAEGGARLKNTAAGMLAHALQIAVAPPAPSGSEAPPARTHRYLQGSVERSERAQQVGGDCARAVLRNLRGWLMSVPLKPAEGEACDQRTPF